MARGDGPAGQTGGSGAPGARARVVLEAPREWEETLLWWFQEAAFGPAAAEEEFPAGHLEGETPPRHPARIVALVPPGRLSELRSAVEDLARTLGWPPGSWRLAWEERGEEDWEALWRRRWRPFRCGMLVIVPDTWEPAGLPLRPGDRLLRLPVGSAFGTGRHGTTRMALRLLQDLTREGSFPRRVLDVGTGSGILAVAAALLGAETVLGMDPDPASPPQARASARANGVGECCRFWRGRLPSAGGRHDLVLANLQADILAEGASVLAGLLAPGGRLVAGGILDRKEAGVRRILGSRGLRAQRMVGSGRWRTLLCHLA